jgi:hypothetical protein
MTTLAPIAILVGDHTRTRSGGGLCPTCRYSTDRGITPHLCITRGDQPDGTCLLWITTHQPLQDVVQLITELEVHPAQPMFMAATTRAGLETLRAVHGSWCSCQCSPNPATVAAGGARS